MPNQNLDIMKKPPLFTEGCCYNTFKEKTKGWEEVTGIPEEKKGMVLALNLPSDGSCNN